MTPGRRCRESPERQSQEAGVREIVDEAAELALPAEVSSQNAVAHVGSARRKHGREHKPATIGLQQRKQNDSTEQYPGHAQQVLRPYLHAASAHTCVPAREMARAKALGRAILVDRNQIDAAFAGAGIATFVGQVPGEGDSLAVR